MKKLFAFLVVAFLVTGATAAKSPSTISNSILQKNGSLIKLFYKGTIESKVYVSIFDRQSNLIFSEVVDNTDEFTRLYNFSQLKQGSYKFKISNGIDHVVQYIEHKNMPAFESARLIKMKEGNDRYMLLVPNKKQQAMDIIVYDANGEQAYRANHHLTGDFSTILNLKQLQGEFTIMLVDSNGETKEFSYSR